MATIERTHREKYITREVVSIHDAPRVIDSTIENNQTQELTLTRGLVEVLRYRGADNLTDAQREQIHTIIESLNRLHELNMRLSAAMILISEGKSLPILKDTSTRAMGGPRDYVDLLALDRDPDTKCV